MIQAVFMMFDWMPPLIGLLCKGAIAIFFVWLLVRLITALLSIIF